MRYFAYGSNLDPAHVAAQCRAQGGRTLTLADGQPAVLDDWELILNVPSAEWGGAVGTLAPRMDAAVFGVLFDVPDADVDQVRRLEGVPQGLAQELKVEARLWTPHGADVTIQLEQATAFVAAEGKSAAEPPPA